MKHCWAPLLALVSLGALPAPAIAAVPQPPKQTAAKQAPGRLVGAPQLSASYFVSEAIAISEAAQSGMLEKIYESSSPVMKNAQTAQAFAALTRQILAANGAATGRDWQSMRRIVVPQAAAQQAGTPPPGTYVSVILAVETGPDRGRLETISFHLDADGQWRFCGFVAEPVGAAASTTSTTNQQR